VSSYLYGLHEPGGEYLYAKNGVSGWIVHTHALGHNPTDNGGVDYTQWDGTPIARLNNGYNPEGTIPKPEFYMDFAKRVGRWANLSLACSRWIIGNEPNHNVEWPEGQRISAEEYALCYILCREEIRIQHGHADDEVILAPVAPWFASGGEGWLEYFNKVQEYILNDDGDIDAFAIHAYTHGPDPYLITANTGMDAPYQNCQFEFQVYKDWMDSIFYNWKKRPVYITEADQNQPWLNQNNGWVKAAYREIDKWNKAGNQTIQCLCLYRWPDYDQYVIEGKQGVIEDLEDTMAYGYKWKEDEMADTVVYSDGFENGFPAFEGKGELMVAQGWKPVWLEDEGNPSVLNRPEFKPAGAAQIRTGSGTQAIHSSFSTIDGAITRTFTVVPGNKYKISVWGMGITGGGGQPKMGMIVQVDQGETLGYAGGASDINSEWWSQDVSGWGNGAWRQMVTPEFVALHPKITVYLRVVTNFAIPANAHFDDFQITTSGGGVTPPPSGGIAEQLLTIADAQLALSGKIRDLASQIGGGSAVAKTLIEEAEGKLQEAKANL